MGDAPGELADQLHFLQLPEAILQISQLGNVMEGEEVVLGPLKDEPVHAGLNTNRIAPWGLEGEFVAECLPAFNVVPVLLPRGRRYGQA